MSILCGSGVISSGTDLNLSPSTALSPYESRFGYLGNPYGILGAQDITKSWTDIFNSGAYFQPFDDMGFQWDRPHPGPFNWNLIEFTKGEYDFSIPDAYVLEAQKRGIQIMATIWPFVEWDQAFWESNPNWEKARGWTSDLPLGRYKPHDMEAYKSFARTLVERYDGDGFNDMPGLIYPIKHWEIMNEPESSRTPSSAMVFFKGTQYDYLDLMQATAEAVWSVDPTATIANGGTVGNNLNYWREILAAGGGRFFTLGSQHYFPSIIPNPDLGATQWINLLNEYGIKGSWNTEYLELSEDHPDIGITASGTGQAERIVKGYTRSFAAGTGRIFYVYYRMKDGGLVIPEGDKSRPAYYTLKTYMSKVDGFTSVTAVATGDNNTSVFAYKFMVNEAPVYVLWAEQARQLELPLSSEKIRGVRVTNSLPADGIGTMPVTVVFASNGTAIIDLTPTPVFVEEFR